MLGRSAGLLAASALSASALVLPFPPAIDPPSADSKRITIRVPCASCTLPTLGLAESDRPQDVQLDLAISDDGKGLLLNGKPFFSAFSHANLAPQPIDAASDVWVHQVDSAHDHPSPIPMLVTDSSLVVKDPRPVSLSGDALIPLFWTITELENEAIALDDVKITLLQTGDGELFIMPAPPASLPPPALPPLLVFTETIETIDTDEPRPDEPCSHLPDALCQLKKTMTEKLDTFAPRKGCHRPRPVTDDTTTPNARPAPSRAHPHPHPHHRHHPRPTFAQAFAHRLLAILVPTLAGVALGIAVSGLAVLLFRAVFYVASKFARRAEPPSAVCGYSDIKHVSVDEVEEESEDEAPPQYQDAPVYEKAEDAA